MVRNEKVILLLAKFLKSINRQDEQDKHDYFAFLPSIREGRIE